MKIRKAPLIGIATVFSIFGIGLLRSSSPAIAKDLLAPGPGSIPSPNSRPIPKQSDKIIKAMMGAASSVCALAVTSASFIVGAVIGVVIFLGF